MNARHLYIMLGFLVTMALVVSGYWFIDKPVAMYVMHLDQGIVSIFQWITVFGESPAYLVCFFILFLFFRFYKQQPYYAKRTLFLFMSIVLSGIVSIYVKTVLGRYRPVMLFEDNLYGFELFSIGHEYNSFPSGHAVTVFAFAAAFSLFWPRYRLLFFCYAFIVAASRVIINAHYFSDTIAGAYIGIMSVCLLRWFCRQYAGDWS